MLIQEGYKNKDNTKTRPYTILEQLKETMLEFSKGTAKVLQLVSMVECSKVNVKLTDTQLKKLKTAVKNKTGTTLRINLKMLNANDLPHELLLTTRQKTKLRNTSNNNMSTDLKLSKAEMSEILQSGRFFVSLN